ncbi:ubiquitin-protein ligase [Lithospermum erythrorhizon]|uniref:Auxin transport protein BIG n=1 Tax=Lithospermum erythrorhizon TaxID=34254 RepID=A0AAV3PHH1_LITER
MAEIAKLVESISVSGDDISTRVRSDSRLRVGLEQLYLLLNHAIKPIQSSDYESVDKLGLQLWEQSQVHALAYVSTVVVHAARCVNLEQVEPIIVAVVQNSMEFALCYLERSIRNNTDDLSLQNYMMQLLEASIFEGTNKDFEASQSCLLDVLSDLLAIVAQKKVSGEWKEEVMCMLQGGVCSKEQKVAECLLMTLASEVMRYDNLAPQLEEESFHCGFKKLVILSDHLAVVHLGCIHRLIHVCINVLDIPDLLDEKVAYTSLRKRLTLCVRAIKLIRNSARGMPYVDFDLEMLQVVASFTDRLSNLFRISFDFANPGASVESSFETLTLTLLEEFLDLVPAIFGDSVVSHNIRASVTASLLETLDSEVWRYSKSILNPKPPLAYFPRVVIYIIKSIMDVKSKKCQVLELKNLHLQGSECDVSSGKVVLLKCYTTEELLKIIFPSSVKWVDNLIHLVFFLHSEGVKLRPKLERSFSSGTKASCTSEAENVGCHDEEALFGDLFSEGGRSVESVDGCDRPVITATYTSSYSNMPVQAAIELLTFLKDNIFSPDWHFSIYEDGCRTLSDDHISSLLSILNCKSCYYEDTARNIANEERKFGNIHELCFGLLHNLLTHRAVSVSLEDALFKKILMVEFGVFSYNNQTLALLAHALVCRSGPNGSEFRTWVYTNFVNFIRQKISEVCTGPAETKLLLESLPSVFHIEVLLMAFHMSSEGEKAVLAKMVLSSLRTIATPSSSESTELSCWALLVSRLVLVLRHMIFYPHACPSSLLLEFKSKLKEAKVNRYSTSNANKMSFWSSVVLEKFMGSWLRDTLANNRLLDQLVDITPTPASLNTDNQVVEHLGMNWKDICSSFSWIMDFWRGTKAGAVEDLIIERYMFVICWDVPIMKSTSEHLLLFLSGLQIPEILNMEHFVYFSHLVISHSHLIREPFDFPGLVLTLLQRLHDLPVSEDVGELGWDFLKSGSWLALVLSLLNVCISKSYANTSINSSSLGSNEGFSFVSEDFLSTFSGTDHAVSLSKSLSSLLKKYLQVYQRALVMISDNSQQFDNKLSPLLLIKHTGVNKGMQDELISEMGLDPCSLESLYDILSNSDSIFQKMVQDVPSKLFWELVLHGFPCGPRVPSAILLSCILNIKGLILVLDGLLRFESTRKALCEDAEVSHQILESVLYVKTDRVFENVHGNREAVYGSLSGHCDQLDLSSLFLVKQLEEFLSSVSMNRVVNHSLYECLITNFVDLLNELRQDAAKIVIFRFYLSVEDVSDKMRDIYGSYRGDLSVLIDSLGSCVSESVNIKVLNFFVDLLSGDVFLGVRQKIQMKFLSMDSLSLSKWLESRLLGSKCDASGTVGCEKESSATLRESTMNFVMCLLPTSSESLTRELHSHLFDAMLDSLDNAFILFDPHIAKSYFTFLVQLSRGESLIVPLLRRTVVLIEKLSVDEHSLHGLKHIFGFLAMVLDECGSNKHLVEKHSAKFLSGSYSAVGSISAGSMGSRINSDTLILPANQGAPTSLDCDATSVDDDEDDGTSDGEMVAVYKDDEEDANSERSLASKVCTFTSSGSNFMEQHWYFCYACDLTVSKGCCSVCAKVCHRGHRVVYSRSSRFFCDCGAGGVRGSSCQCLKPRKYNENSNAPNRGADNFQSFIPFAQNSDQLPDTDSDIDEDSSPDMDNSVKLSITKEVQDEIAMLFRELDMEGHVLKLCSSLLPSIVEKRDSYFSRDKSIVLGEDKVLCYSGDLFQLKKAYKSGSLDLKIKTDYSNAKELKSHLASGSLVKSLLSVSTRGRLAVGEGDKVAIFDVGQLIGQATIAPVTADKANVKPVSKNVVRFEIVHLIFNPLVENYLCVAGYEDCQVLTVNHRGEVTDRLAIELALQGAYIRRVDWVPGSQVQLMVVTNRFVKIYDLSQDTISPMHYFTLRDDIILDATLVVASQGRLFIVVLSEQGTLYRTELSMKGNIGAKTLKEIIHIDSKDSNTKGSSLYFSTSHKLLLLSYQDGTTLFGRLNSDATSLVEKSAIFENEPEGNLRLAGLHRWKELVGGSGLFVCSSSVKSNTVFAVSIGEREILVQNMRHAIGSASPLVGITAYKPLSKDKFHCLVLHDDGSLQIYSHVPSGVDIGSTAVSDKIKKLGPGILANKVFGGAKPEFPLDFFEKTICITPDVKLSGDAIRNGESEAAKKTLASEDGFLESPNPGGFKVTVSNSNPDIVMVGLRLHVGNTSASHIPSEITLFQRTIKLDEGMRSWYDIPFTVAESLLADEEVIITVGPTFSGSALPRIDCLEVYGRAKDEFGWKEKMDAVLHMETRVLGNRSSATGSSRKSRPAPSASVQEEVVADGLKLLSSIYLLYFKVEEVKVELSKLRCRQLLEVIFESDREALLLKAACFVLQAVYPNKEIYHHVKDTLCLTGVVKSSSNLSLKLGTGTTTAGWIIEEFTAQMRAVSKIALHRRSNLASFLETNGSEVVDGLMQVLWGILELEQPDTQTMNNIVVASVELIYCYAECLASGKHSVGPAVSLFKKLLFSTNEAVQTSSSLAISSRLLQVPFPKQTMLGADDAAENATSVSSHIEVSGVAGNSQAMVDEDLITSSVQYCCDGCSTVPILRRRWHCTICPDFDLCEACYEVLDADRLPPPHSRDHPMTAIPIEMETLGGESSEIHFAPNELSDSGLMPVTDVGMQSMTKSLHELVQNESNEFVASVIDPVTISASSRAVNSLILSELLEQLRGWMETTSGVQAVPILQLFYRLSSAIGGPFVESFDPNSINMEKLVKWFVDEINLNRPFAAKSRSSFGEVIILVFMFFTLMLRNWNQPGTDGSTSKSTGTIDALEKSTFHTVSSSSVSSAGGMDVYEKNDFISHLSHACGFIRQQSFVNYLMDILQQLVHVFKAPSVAGDTFNSSNPAAGCGALLTVRRELPAGNFSPFFTDSYAKSHRSDMFGDFHRLLLENTFRLVYSLIRPEKHDKAGDKEKSQKIASGKDLKLDGYQDILCSYINNPHTTFVRRYARRLFLHLCGSKTHYYSVRDSWQFSNEVNKLYKHVNKSGGLQSVISYERSVKIVKCLTTMAEVALARPRNWQKYCLRHGDILPFLLNGAFYFGEECVIQTLKLLSLAFYSGKDGGHFCQKGDGGDNAATTTYKSGTQSSDSNSKKKKKSEDGGESGSEKSYLDMEPVLDVFLDRGGELLRQFIDMFLLEWSSSSVRTEAKCMLHGLWSHGKQSFKETLLTVLLQKVHYLPMYGQNIVEYTELVTSLLGKVPDISAKQLSTDIIDKCLTSDVLHCIFETLHSQNELLANHPNSRIYNTLSGLVEFDGYYLESEPCVACSSPEVPYSRMKLETLKSETKFTDNRIIVKCTGSYTIQSVTMNVHDARKSKSVKVLNLYYNNRPVADLSELKNNWSLWKRAKSCCLASNQTELIVEFPIPITACNFMIELDSFYENLQALSLEPLQCPRCSRPVTDKHGICTNCHENAYQCRQCRNINYENLDSFLCNECGYSKYGRFEFNFMAKPSFTFDSMENDEDMKRGLAAIESESENAHRRYQQLLGFKKPLLKIVSSIGENDMDSQQKDSVQQMMVSLPGPSCKINRKVALLGVLYGEKCKAAFDSVSKSVQTLQGLRRVLMSYLHKKQSDGTLGASRFVMTRCPKSCYGCASTFVTQCLEVLQVLSKHPSSKKQLVSAGILSELFENNIHQGPKTARVQARAALCAFSEGDMNAVVELNNLIQKKVMYCLEHHRSMDIALATREELLLLSDVCSLTDEFWESRLRVVFQLLFSSIKLGAKHPAISEHVILPCLRIVSQACTPPKPDIAEKELVSGKASSVPPQKEETNSLISSEKSYDGLHKSQDIQLLSYSEWEKGASYLDFVRRQYKVTQAVKGLQKSRSQKYDYLALKYALRWKRRASKTGRSEMPSFELGSWVTELILSACSPSIRSEMCMLIGLLCGQSPSRQFRLLNLLMSLLPATLSAGENAAEYIELLFRMIESEDARLFLTVRGCLSTLCKLIGQEVASIESLERSLHINISQGFILHKLIELLGKFLHVPNIRSRFMREKLLSEVLETLIVIRGLIVQKTKLISDCNILLKDLLDSLLLESNENKRQFIQACICGLQVHGDDKKGRASLFILEQLCNLICPSKPEPVYLLILNKAHTQEEFIRGSMTKNPYSSSEVGPLMRDVKNKICHQLDLLGLVEDDYGMELLVAGNIISLDLSIGQVYEQVWKKSPQFSASAAGSALLSSSSGSSARDSPPMNVTYRLQGLDGEATEPMIKELDEDREESQDPEVEFAITGAVRECGGLEILLGFLQRLQDDLKSNQERLLAVLRLLMLCCKTRENRRALLKLGALGLLLETARRAFSVDAMEPAEGILLIVESLTVEANESDRISITPGILTVSTEEAGAGDQAKKIVLMFLERLSQPSGLKKSNKQQRNTEMVARILPYLTYGEPAAMEALIQHFDPYLRDWGEFDIQQLRHEDNLKDEKLADNAIKQKFALENFVRVSESLKSSSCGERLKDIILEKGITSVAIKYLKDTFPFTSQAGYKSTSEWVSGLKLPSVPLILSMLRGLSMGHLPTQKCIDEGGILPLLHALEGVAGENDIGARAENLLDTLSDKEGNGDGFLGDKVRHLRHATRDEMRRRALRKREELLQGLGMRQELSSDGGERIVVARPVLEGFDDVEEEEDGLACMVCREGYRLRPMDLLGVYTYSKRVNLGSGNARGDCVYTTVSHFNIIHFQCHQEAKRADAALKNPKKEWDGAALRNNETLCNNLFPLRGPSVQIAQYIRYVDQYWDYLNAIGRADGTRLRLLTYDIVLMLARFATGASFSADCRGGGKESNARFFPFMIQMARHLLDHDSSQRLGMAKSITTYLSSPSIESKPANSPGGQPSAASEETVQFMMVSSLLSESYESWVQHRRAFLQRGIYHAYMQQAHGRSTHRSSTTTPVRPDLGSTSRNVSRETGGSEELLSVIQPMLVYTGMIEQLQHFFKVKRSNAATVQSHKTLEEVGVDESLGLEDWELVMKEKLLNVKEMVGFSKELLSWLDDMTSASDLQEAFDIIGVLGDVLSPGITSCEEFVHAAINAGKS